MKTLYRITAGQRSQIHEAQKNPNHLTLPYSLNMYKVSFGLKYPPPSPNKIKAPRWQISVVVPAKRFDLTHSVEKKKNTLQTPMRLCGESLPVLMKRKESWPIHDKHADNTSHWSYPGETDSDSNSVHKYLVDLKVSLIWYILLPKAI